VLILNAAAMGCMVYSVVQRPVRRVADSPQSAQRTEQASDSELLVVERGSLEQLTKEGVDVGRLADVALKDGKVIVHINVTEAARLSSKHD
jgi:hypothetical protein